MSSENNDNGNGNNNNQKNNKNEDESFSLFNQSSDKKNDINNNNNNIEFNSKTFIKKSNQKNFSNKHHLPINPYIRNLDNNNENNENIENPYKNSGNKKNNNKKIDDPKILKELEEKRKKKESEEKEKNKIRDRLKCFICFGKAINATMCTKCKGIACEECVKKMLLKNPICSNCKQPVLSEDMVKLPFMNDLTEFFIHNVEQNYDSKKNNDINNEMNINNSDKQDNFMEESCKFHPNRKIEYMCLTCGEYLCSECLIFFNKENVAKHTNHIILSNEQINEFNLNKVIKEYKLLYDKKNNLDKNITNYDLTIKEIQIRKKRVNDVIDSIKHHLQSKYSKKIEEIKYYSNLLKNKKNEIELGIKSFPDKFNKLKEANNTEQNKCMLNELKRLNIYPINKEEIEKKTIFQKNICCESYESEIIDFEIPNRGIYVEAMNVLNKELNFIPNTSCKLQSQLLCNFVVLTLIIEVNSDFYEKHHPKYFGNIIIISQKTCEYAFLTDYYNKGEQILTYELDFSKMKSFLDEKHKCKLRFHITRNFYK